jgi:hypothetical protein
MKRSKQILPHVARYDSTKERWQLVVIGLAAIYEGLVSVLSLGYLNTDIRGWVLFDLFGDK